MSAADKAAIKRWAEHWEECGASYHIAYRQSRFCAGVAHGLALWAIGKIPAQFRAAKRKGKAK